MFRACSAQRTLVATAVCLIVYVIIGGSAAAQSSVYGFGPNINSVPLPVENGFVDALNGNLHLEIPIASFPERGHVPYMAKLIYDSHIWQIAAPTGTATWQPTNVANSNGGWRMATSGSPGLVTYAVEAYSCNTRLGDFPYIAYDQFSWTTPDGHQIFFPVSTNRSNQCITATPSSDGIAIDASGYHMYVTNYTVVTVYAPDGTRVFPNVRDTNGNYYSSDANGNIVDTLGRTPITVTTGTNSIMYAILNSQNATYNIIVNTTSIPVHTAFGQSGVTEYSGNITVVGSVNLPDNTSYSFSYDQGSTGAHYGTLTSMALPTGGTINYTHSNFTDAFGNHYLWVATRTFGGGQWTYTPQVITSCGSSCSQKMTATQPSGDQEQYTFTMYNNNMWNTLVKFYTGSASSGTLLQTVQTDYNTSNPPYIQPIRVTTTLPVPGGSLMKKVEVTYDTSNLGNIVNQNQWKFYTAFPTTQDRKLSYTYLVNSDNNLVNKRTSVSIYQGSNNMASSSLTTNYDGTATSSITGVVHHDDTLYGTSYTPRGNPTSIINNVLTTTLTYDMTGQATQVTDSNNNVTSFSYANNFFDDSTGGPTAHSVLTLTNAYPTTIALPSPFSWTMSLGYYWGSGKLAERTDQNGATTTLDYLDSWDRLTKSVLPLGWSMFNYPSAQEADNYLGIQDATPSQTCSSCRHDQINLDSFGRLQTRVLVSDFEGADTQTVSYDSSSRVQSVTNPARSTSSPTDGSDTYTYDGLGRAIQVAHTDGTSSHSYYGAAVTTQVGGITAQLCSTSTYGNGFPVLFVDEAGKKRQRWTDGFGRTIEVDEPDNSGNLTLSTCYSYDVLNNLTGVTQGSQTRSYVYDSLSRLLTATAPESGTVHYYYTTSGGSRCSGNPGAVCRRTDARGITTTYTYDQLNRLTQMSHSDSTPTVNYTYDSGTNQKGFRTGMTDGSGSTTWTYNAVGWVGSEQQTIAGIAKTISYTYNQDGSVASVTYPSGRTITYSVGNAQRTLSATDVTNNIQYAATASYAPPGGVNSVFYGPAMGFNGINQTASYNSRLETTAVSASSSAGTAQSLAFSYSLPSGNDGTLTGVQNNVTSGLSESFTYDSLSRILTGATSSGSASGCWGESFGPAGTPPPGPPDDRYGNLSQINLTQCSGGMLSVTVNAATNQISTSGYQYDASGNMTAEGGVYAYTFDAESHLTSAVGPGTNGFTYCYVYDGNGLRVEKFHVSSGTCAAPQNPVVDALYWRAVTGAAIAETDGTGNTQNEYVFFGGQRIARRDANGNVYYYYADQVGSTVTMTDGSGNPCYQATFTPYGEEHATQTTCAQNYKFTGYERDAETGLDYAFARYYNSRLGRFLSADPLGGDVLDPQSLNRYAYVQNSPTNLTDPSGMLLTDCNDGIFCEFHGSFEGIGWIGQPYFLAFPDAGCDYDREGNLIGCSLGTGSYVPAWLLPTSGHPFDFYKYLQHANNAKPPCISTESLNWLQKAQLTAAQFYASLTGWTFGFGVGLDAGAGIGPKGSSWNFGVGGSGSTLIVADASGNSGFLNSASGGFSATKMSSSGSWWGAGAAAGPSFLVSRNPISTIAGPSGSFSAGGGAVLGAGVSVTTSGAATLTFGVGAGAEAGVSQQFGTSQYIPFCKN